MAIKNYSDFSGKYNYMSNAYNKKFSKKYDKYTADLQYDVPRLSKKANEALADSYIKAKSFNNRSSLDIKAKRSNWDRAGDVLSTGQYAVMGGLKGALSDELTVAEGIASGLKAANPFGDGYEKGEHEFKQVLEELGWKPETTVGKAARWTVGLLGDIFLDPTTYLTLCSSALAKGTGKVAIKSKKAVKIAELAGKYGLDGIDDVAKIADEAYTQTLKRFAGSTDVSSELIERLAKKNKDDVIRSVNMLEEGMTIDDAIDIVRKKNVLTADDALKIANKDKTNQTIREFVTKGGNKTTDEIAKNADELMKKFNKTIGISGAKEGITISLANAPFGKKIFGEAADGMFTVVSGETLQKIGDKTVALGYQQLRDKVLGGQFGKLFSSKSLLYQAAKTNPGAVYDMLKYAEHVRGLKGDIVESEKMIRSMYKELHDLDPATANEVMELMQDKAKWVQVQKTIKLVDTQEGQAIRKRVEQDVKILKSNLEKFKTKQAEYEALLKDTHDIIKDMETASAGISADKAKAMQDLYSESIKQREEIVAKLNTERLEELTKIAKEYIPDEKIIDDVLEEFEKVDIQRGDFDAVVEEVDNVEKIQKFLDDFNELKNKSKAEMELNEFKQTFVKDNYDITGRVGANTTKDKNKIFKDMMENGAVVYAKKSSAENFLKKFPTWEMEEVVTESGKKQFRLKPSANDTVIVNGKFYSTNSYFDKQRKLYNKITKSNTFEGRVTLIEDMSELLYGRRDMFDRLMPERLVREVKKRLEAGESIKMVRYYVDANADQYSGKVSEINKFVAKYLNYADIRDVGKRMQQLERTAKTTKERNELIELKATLEKSELLKDRLTKANSVDEMKQVMQDLVNKKEMDDFFESDIALEAVGNRRKAMLQSQSDNKKKKGYDGSEAYSQNRKVNEDLKLQEQDNISKDNMRTMLEKRMLGNLPKDAMSKKDQQHLEQMTDELFRVFKDNVPDKYVWSKLGSKTKEEFIKIAAHNLTLPVEKRVYNIKQIAEEVLNKNIQSQRYDAMREAIESAKEKPVDLGEMAIKSDIVDESIQRADNMIETINKKYDEMIAKATKEFDEVRRREAFDMRMDFVKRGENIKKSKREYEELYKKYKREYLTKYKQTQKFYDNFDGEIERLQNVINDDMAFETYYRYKYSNAQADAILEVYNKDLGKVLLDPNLKVDEKTRTVAEKLRESFIAMGKGEVKYDKLDEKAFEAHLLDYFPHVITEEGAEYFAKNSSIEGLAGFGTDLGYGKKFNPYGMERTIKKILMPDDTWVINPTVAQINEAFKHKLKGANLFSDNLADVYMARAMKNNELMYDNEYMRNMLDTFGKPFVKGDVLEPGKKLVMNHGMLRKNIEEMAEMEVSMEMGNDIRNFIRTNNLYKKLMSEAEMMYGKGTSTQAKVARKKYINVEMQKYIDNYVKGKYTDEVKSKMYQSVIDKNSHDHIKDITMPMVEMDIDEYSRISDAFEDVNDRYIQSVKERFQRFESNYVNDYFDEKKIGTYDFQDVMNMDTKQLRGYIKNRILKVDEVDATRLERMMADLDKLDQIQPLKANQVVEAITQKANQARKMAVIKDNSDMLKLYDKFTHFIKLNQTTVLPSFHLRNAYSNTFQNWLAVGADVMNKDLQTNAFKVMKNEGLNDALLEINHIDGSKTQISWTDLFDKARKYGAVGDGYYDLDIKTGSKTKGLFKKLDPKLDPTNTAEFAPYQIGAKIGTIVESKDRLLHFASMVSRGHSYEEAAESVNKFLFDYSDLTGFETSVMKRILPYYTWLRKNAALQLDQMIENPKKYYYVNKVLNGIESMTDDEDRVNKAFVNDFALDWIQLPINVTNPQGRQEPILFNPNLPFMDLNRIPNPSDITGSMQSLFSQSNPLLKIPVEQALNKNFFFDSPIVEEGDNQVLNRADHIASQFGMYGVATGLVQKKGLDKGLHILNNVTGIKLLSYDYEKYKAIKIQELVQHGRKKNTEEKIKEYISDSMSNFGDTLVEGFKTEYSHAVNAFGDALYKDMPTKPSEYQGALRPLSQAKYDALSDIEKVKYTPPTAEDAIAYNKKALELYDEQMMKQSPGKRVIWAMFDGVEWGKRQQKFELGEVQEVADGDTFTIKVGDETKSVRLLLVDTPETVDPDVKKVMPYGKESSDYSKNYLMGKDVKIYFDNEEKDRYGRTLAYVEIDGVDYNKLLLDEGLAQTRYIVEPPYKRLQDYLESEKEASNNKKGIWSIDGYATPGIDDNYDTYNEAVKRWLEKK